MSEQICAEQTIFSPERDPVSNGVEKKLPYFRAKAFPKPVHYSNSSISGYKYGI